MPERDPFEYVVIRIMPRVERGECLNAGVALICRPQRYLAARVHFDEARLLALAPWLEVETVQELRRQVEVIPGIAAGNSQVGPIARMDQGERWHWLTAPSSTMIQPGPVHTGLCSDPAAELEELFARMVTICE